MVILEAMMSGLPVIATRVGGIPNAVGENTLLVDAQDPAQLARARNQMMVDAQLRRVLAERGKERATKNYGVERMVDQYLDWYTEVLGSTCRNLAFEAHGKSGIK
jgi:glycosyltransferase involved in cell wall biosynthesis